MHLKHINFFILLTLVNVALSCANEIQEVGPDRDSPAVLNFMEFMRLRMDSYNSWAEDQSLNAPYRVQTQSIVFSNLRSTMFDLAFTFSDMTVTNGLVADDASYYKYGALADILDGSAKIEFEIPSVTVTGNYNTSGVLNGESISKSGTWKLDCGLRVTYEVRFTVNGSNITPTTSTVAGIQRFLKDTDSINMTIGGLFNGNEDSYIQQMITWRIGTELSREMAIKETPLALKDPFDRYLYPQLEQTLISDMIRPQRHSHKGSRWISIRQESTTESFTDPPVSKAFRFEIPLLVYLSILSYIFS